MNVPDHYQPLMPYLVVENADDFIAFITTVFDAEEKLRVNRKDDGSLMHGEYNINGGTIMLGESSADWKPFPCAMYLVTADVDDLYHRGLENGAASNQEPGERGYGRSAGFLDPWGNQWWLNDPETRED